MLSLRRISSATCIRGARMMCARGDGHLSAGEKGKITTHTGQVSWNRAKNYRLLRLTVRTDWITSCLHPTVDVCWGRLPKCSIHKQCEDCQHQLGDWSDRWAAGDQVKAARRVVHGRRWASRTSESFHQSRQAWKSFVRILWIALREGGWSSSLKEWKLLREISWGKILWKIKLNLLFQ